MSTIADLSSARAERAWAIADLLGALVMLGVFGAMDWLLWQLLVTDAGELAGGVQLDMLLFLLIFVHVVALLGLLTLTALGATGWALWRVFSRQS